MANYIQVSDDGDGIVSVDDRDGGIATYVYADRLQQLRARAKAEAKAQLAADELRCDWGCNY